MSPGWGGVGWGGWGGTPTHPPTHQNPFCRLSAHPVRMLSPKFQAVPCNAEAYSPNPTPYACIHVLHREDCKITNGLGVARQTLVRSQL